jgi:hypothetical protein
MCRGGGAAANAFSKTFLHQVRRLPEPSDGPPALLTGPWDVEPVAAEPDALALVLESLGPESLALLGRVLARRLEEVG